MPPQEDEESKKLIVLKFKTCRRQAFECRVLSTTLRQRARAARLESGEILHAIEEQRRVSPHSERPTKGGTRSWLNPEPQESPLTEEDSYLVDFVKIRTTCADLAEVENILLETISNLRQEQQILGLEAEALGRKLNKSE